MPYNANIMTLDDARNRIQQQLDLSSGYSRNALRTLLSEVARTHGSEAVDGLIAEFNLESLYQIYQGTIKDY